MRAARAQNSPEVAVDPTDSDVVALAVRVDRPDFSCGLELSGDGGRLWAPVDPVPLLPEGVDKCYGPEVAFDSDGTLFYLFVGLEGPGNRPYGVYLTSSEDRGRSWSQPWEVLGPGNYQVRMVLDRAAGGEGRMHLVWLRTSQEPGLGGLPAPPNPIVASHSDDRGRSWSEPVLVSDPEGQPRAVAPAVALGVDGAVHVAFYDLEDDSRDYRGLEGDTWPGTWSVMHGVSTNRGETFEEPVVVDDGVVPPERVMLIFTMAPPAVAAGGDGGVHVAWHDGRNGDWDVFAAASDDQGGTWGRPVRVNDDRRGNGRHQLLPQVGVGPDGRVEVVFFDRRNDDSNVYQHVYYSRSVDQGATFEPNVRVTSLRSTSHNGARYGVPSARGQYDLGTRLALIPDKNASLAAWPDSRDPAPGTGGQNVFTTLITQPGWDGIDADQGSTGGIGGWPAAVGIIAVALVGVIVWRRHLPSTPPTATPVGGKDR